MKRLKHPSVGAFNAGRGSLHALHPQPRRQLDTKQEYQLLTEWETQNNRTRDQTRTLIKNNKLLAVKHKGRWWVAINPDCEDLLEDI